MAAVARAGAVARALGLRARGLLLVLSEGLPFRGAAGGCAKEPTRQQRALVTT